MPRFAQTGLKLGATDLALLEARARDAGVSVAELVRRWTWTDPGLSPETTARIAARPNHTPPPLVAPGISHTLARVLGR